MEETKIWFTKLNLKIYLSLAFIVLTLLFYSIWEIKPVTVDVYDFLGLTSHLTAVYWIGYILIILFSIKLYLDKQIKNDLIYLIYIIADISRIQKTADHSSNEMSRMRKVRSMSPKRTDSLTI